MPSELWTIGHSTRPIEEFLGLLLRHGIQVLADVRTIPFSRRNPQFHQDALAKSLQDSEIQYRHIPALGGRRKSRSDSVNEGWRNQGFRGYADYMQTQEFGMRWNISWRLVFVYQWPSCAPKRCPGVVIGRSLRMRWAFVEGRCCTSSRQAPPRLTFSHLSPSLTQVASPTRPKVPLTPPYHSVKKTNCKDFGFR
jgi:hypothetical protein